MYLSVVIRPWQILIVAAAGWISRHQDVVIGYLREEKRILKQQLGGQRLRLNDVQRRRLAAKGKALGYRVLSDVATIVTAKATGPEYSPGGVLVRDSDHPSQRIPRGST